MTRCTVCPGAGHPLCIWPHTCPSTVGLPQSDPDEGDACMGGADG